jgi:hypothetical protein
MRYTAIAVAMSMIAMSSPARADYCTESVVQVIENGDQVFFTTNKSCPNWCQVNPALSESARDRMFSLLLTAASGGRKISTYFDGVQACQAVPAYSSPVSIIYFGL